MPVSVNTTVPPVGAELAPQIPRSRASATEAQEQQQGRADSSRPERVVQGEVIRVTRDLDSEALSLQNRQASNESFFLQRNSDSRLLNASPEEAFREIDRQAQEENTQAIPPNDNLVDVFV